MKKPADEKTCPPGNDVLDNDRESQLLDFISREAAHAMASRITPDTYLGRKREDFVRRTSRGRNKKSQCEIRIGDMQILNLSGPDEHGELKVHIAREVYLKNGAEEEHFFPFGMSVILSTNGPGAVYKRRLEKAILSLDARLDRIEMSSDEDLFDLSSRLLTGFHLWRFDFPGDSPTKVMQRLYNKMSLRLQKIEAEVEALLESCIDDF